MIVTTLEDRVVEGFLVGDIDATLVGEDSCFNLPVRKVGAEWERDILVHGLDSLEDER